MLSSQSISLDSSSNVNEKNDADLLIKNLHQLQSSLKQNFPIDYGKTVPFVLYPFSTDHSVLPAVKKIESLGPQKTKQIRVAILFGESNFLSMLPELSKHADLIVLADIQPKLHEHTNHLLNIFLSADFPNDFIKKFENHVNSKGNEEIRDRYSVFKSNQEDLGEHHFLFKDRFTTCQQIAKKIFFEQIDFNLIDAKACNKLANLLKINNAIITFCNFTNIHLYDDKSQMLVSTSLLLQYSPNCIVMHSDGRKGLMRLDAKINQGIKNFHVSALKKDCENFRLQKNHNTFNHKLKIVNAFLNKIANPLITDGESVKISEELVPKFTHSPEEKKIALDFSGIIKCQSHSDPLQVKIGKALYTRLYPYFPGFKPGHYSLLEKINHITFPEDMFNEIYLNTSKMFTFPTEIKKCIAASKISFWYKRTRDENNALEAIGHNNHNQSPLAQSILKRRSM